MNRFFTYITYVASQLSYKYYKNPESEMSDFFYDDSDFADWKKEEWQAAIKNIFLSKKLSWVEGYKRHFDFDGRKLARACYEHLYNSQINQVKNILILDHEYPPILKTIENPPLCINIQGDESLLDYPKVAVIGSRKACLRSLRESYYLAQGLARRSIVVVSGGAYGCDVRAHGGVISSGVFPLPAIVVFAGGLSELYPKGNHAVFRKLREGKAVFLSERLWSTKAKPIDFPIRNRIISGLSDEVVVMQAGGRSGSMVTAKIALDQGREVSVLHFEEGENGARGSLQLQEDGAQVFSSAEHWMDLQNSEGLHGF